MINDYTEINLRTKRGSTLSGYFHILKVDGHYVARVTYSLIDRYIDAAMRKSRKAAEKAGKNTPTRTLDVILNGHGKNKARKKVNRQLIELL